MVFTPLDLMNSRIERARADSDTAFFHDLLYAGELIIRLTTSAVVAAIDDDLDRHRYRLIHGLVRSNGIGEWTRVIDDALTGSASQHLVSEAKEDRLILTERSGSGSWQYEALLLLNDVLTEIEPGRDQIPSKVQLRSWFTFFAELRNKTRGHGAPTASLCSSVCPKLERTIRLICSESPLFQRPWAYLHRNQSGKYRVVAIGGNDNAFSYLKTANAASEAPYSDGVYIYYGSPRRVDLIYTDVDVSDFFFPNGSFNGKRFELHSLITDDRTDGDVSPYLISAGELPTSETHGVGQLEIIGSTWSNMPPAPMDYVPRPGIEKEVTDALTNDRHPIVTLVGRGGIGKTSLALQILHKIAASERFDAIVWFSARDIDLLSQGPKIVKPQVVTEKDISSEFVELLGYASEIKSSKSAIEFMSESLRNSHLVGPILFVFDNFETMASPVDTFNWIDANIRLPNKALITTRFREFKADYPVGIGGMDSEQCNELISRTAEKLNVLSLMTTPYIKQIIEESDGHPYVIKIMIGEVADTRSPGKPRLIISRKDDVLDALFERTFANLSPLASRIFLTLSGWRSLVPQFILESVVLRDRSEQLDTSGAVDELVRMSLVERMACDGVEFLNVPLTAAIFGSRKLSVSPNRLIIENDIKLLQDLGHSTAHNLKEGALPRIKAFFSKIASRVSDGKMRLEDIQNSLEFIARSYPPAWLLLADLHEEIRDVDSLQNSIIFVRRYIEVASTGDHVGDAWKKLFNLYRRARDLVGACDAFVRAYEANDISFDEISNMVNWVNNNLPLIVDMDMSDRQVVLRSLAGLMERRIQEATATDLSRLAWLHLHANNVTRSREVAEMGLNKESENGHCIRLLKRLSEQ